MRQLFEKHFSFWSQRSLRVSAVLSFLLLLLSLVINYLANLYTSLHASNYVSDLILDHLPVINVDFIFFEGFSLFLVFVAGLLIREPRKIPFVLKSIALFILIRSAFMILTHVAIPPNHSYVDPNRLLEDITSGSDLFFSSHTGLPYLMALIFWKNKFLRIIFLLAAAFFGFSVLLGHLHYSIDVFSAFFITYSIFKIAQRFFSKDYQLLD